MSALVMNLIKSEKLSKADLLELKRLADQDGGSPARERGNEKGGRR